MLFDVFLIELLFLMGFDDINGGLVIYQNKINLVFDLLIFRRINYDNFKVMCGQLF